METPQAPYITIPPQVGQVGQTIGQVGQQVGQVGSNAVQSAKKVADWGYEIKKGEIKAPTIIAFVFVLLLIAYILLRKQVKDTFAGTPDNTPYKEPYGVHGTVTDAWLKSQLDGYVQTLNVQLTTTYMTDGQAAERCKIYEKCVKELNDNQLIAVCNTYKKRYNKTVRFAMSEATWSGCGYVFGTQYGELLVNRLNALTIP